MQLLRTDNQIKDPENGIKRYVMISWKAFIKKRSIMMDT